MVKLSAMSAEERIAYNRDLAMAYVDSYIQHKVEKNQGYEGWKFSDDAYGYFPYFTGNDPIVFKDYGMDIVGAAQNEAHAYTRTIPDFTILDYKIWPREDGWAWRLRFGGTYKKTGKQMGFWVLGFIDTNEFGEITRWDSFMEPEEFSPWLDIVIGIHGPFMGDSAKLNQYVKALARAIKGAGEEVLVKSKTEAEAYKTK